MLYIISACSNREKEILPVPSIEPNEAQLKQIERKYGMFIHFGINTFDDTGIEPSVHSIL